MILTKFLNDEKGGICWPAQTTLASQLKRHKRTIARYAAILRSAGYLECSKAFVGQGTIYRARLPGAVEEADTGATLGEEHDTDGIHTEPKDDASGSGRMTPAASRTDSEPAEFLEPPNPAMTGRGQRNLRSRGAKFTREETAEWLAAVFSELDPLVLDVFRCDWKLACHENPSKREMVINAVRTITGRPESLARLREVILADNDPHHWAKFLEDRSVKTITVHDEYRTYAVEKAKWGNVAAYLMDRIWKELPVLR